jgi:hypothetical protein
MEKVQNPSNSVLYTMVRTLYDLKINRVKMASLVRFIMR